MNDVIINIFLAVMQTVLAVVATIIAINQRREQKYDMRCEDLKKLVNSLNNERYWYYAAAKKYYDKLFVKSTDGCVMEHVLFKSDWMPSDESDDFVLLKDVAVHIPESNDDIWDKSKNPHAVFLPTKAEGYAENVKYHCGVRLMSLPLYAMENIVWDKNSGTVDLYVKKGYYFDFYDSCEVMSAEMAYYRRIKTQGSLLPGKLPIRDSVKDVFDLKNRFAGIGIITLTILKNVTVADDKKKNFFLVHKRSQKVAEGTGSYHAVPAGSYQPAAVEFPESVDPADKNLESTVIREFGEELFGIDEFENLYNSKLLQGGLGLPHPFFMGVGLDPLNLKTELMACMIIDAEQDSRAERPVFGGKKTFSDIEKVISDSYEGAVSLKELTPVMLRQFYDNPMSIPSFRQLLKTVDKHRAFFGVEEN